MLYIDLTLPISNDAPPFPGDTPPYITTDKTIEKDGFQVQTWTLSSHQGTHIDAPAHVFPKGKCLSDYPLSKFIRPLGALFSSETEPAPNLEISFSDRDMEKLDGSFTSGSVLIFLSGWREIAEKNHYDYFRDAPSLKPEFAEWIASQKFSMFGMDLPSPDWFNDSNLTCHKILLKQDILLLENLYHPENLRKGAGHHLMIHAVPLSVRNAEASPVRVFAYGE
ncbi:MAG: cyclase family protein [Planctomycetia bacterium]|nr:cyclase family protein [Planctomycetia bacterium]